MSEFTRREFIQTSAAVAGALAVAGTAAAAEPRKLKSATDRSEERRVGKECRL